MDTFSRSKKKNLEKASSGSKPSSKAKSRSNGSRRGPSSLEKSMENLLKRNGLEGYEKEFRFHESRMWRFDFAWPDKFVALEVEGGIWNRGRHQTAKGYSADCEKYSEAAILGWYVIRVTEPMIKTGMALDLISRALETN